MPKFLKIILSIVFCICCLPDAKALDFGTDSLASNDSLSIVEELKAIPDVPLPELYAWATINGARALGMESDMGSVEVGKRCGLVLTENLDSRDGSLRLASESRTRRLL